jgi:nitrite reductase/ring-hydroxylating ferredoxin subunit
MGGPLAQGSREGDTVTCPWHLSRFDLRTGAVVEGPAVFVSRGSRPACVTTGSRSASPPLRVSYLSWPTSRLRPIRAEDASLAYSPDLKPQRGP